MRLYSFDVTDDENAGMDFWVEYFEKFGDESRLKFKSGLIFTPGAPVYTCHITHNTPHSSFCKYHEKMTVIWEIY